MVQVKPDVLAKFASSSKHKLKVYNNGTLVDLKKSSSGGRSSSRK
jgi:hypothetical protein